jgi:hypothetical protein
MLAAGSYALVGLFLMLPGADDMPSWLRWTIFAASPAAMAAFVASWLLVQMAFFFVLQSLTRKG